MKAHLFLTIVTAAAAVLSVGTARSAELGDPAAPLAIAEWVKGKPVDLDKTKGKSVVVVEFWATWCGPCRASIPHLTEMAKKFASKDVLFVGVSDETTAKVKPFVDKMGEKMDYNVAIDRDKKTSAGYMQAYGVNGIPHAFVVSKENKVIWQGHPMAGLDEALQRIVAGTYDLATEKKRSAAQSKIEEYYRLAASGKDETKLETLGKELQALDKELGGLTPGEKLDLADMRKRAQFSGVMRRYQQAFFSGKSESEIDTLEKQVAELAPKGFEFGKFKEQMQLNRVFGEYYQAVTTAGNSSKADAAKKKLESLDTKNAEALNNFAWTILTDEDIKNRDTKLALKLAKAANDASGGDKAHILDTYARALFDNGDKAEAVKVQQRAVDKAQDADMKAELEQHLKQYRGK